MPKRPANYPTELELQILKILWKRAPQAVREVRLELAEQGRDLAHTSVITTLTTMLEKRFVSRTMQANACLFAPAVTWDDVSDRMLGDVVERVFDGSAKALVLKVFESADLDGDDLKELRKLLNAQVKKKS